MYSIQSWAPHTRKALTSWSELSIETGRQAGELRFLSLQQRGLSEPLIW